MKNTCFDVKQLSESTMLVFCSKCGNIHIPKPERELSQTACANCGMCLEDGLVFTREQVVFIKDEDFLKSIGVKL